MARQLVVYVMDKSGSMLGLKKAVISAFNEFLHEQQQEATRRGDDVALSLAMFDANWSQGLNTQGFVLAYDQENIHDIPDMTDEQYVPSGGTALYDAIADAVVPIGLDNDWDRVVCVVQTDGQENSSMRTTMEDVRKLVEERTDAGWLFIYLGAGLDEMARNAHVRQSANIAIANSLAYDANSPHAHLRTSRTMSESVSSYFAGGKVRPQDSDSA